MDAARLEAWAAEVPVALELLCALSFDADRRTARRAAQAMGIAARVRAAADVEDVRDRIRRLLWSMNHESGNLVWLAPDMIGEMIVGAPSLAPEYTRVLAAFINLEPFVEGVHRALARIGSVSPESIGYLEPYLVHALSDDDAGIRLSAARALAAIDPVKHLARITQMRADPGSIADYDPQSHEIVVTTVGKAISDTL
jgi:HEAT repeat protein